MRKTARLEDPGAELLDSMTTLRDRYGRVALIALAVIVAIGAGAFFTLRARASSEEQAAGHLGEASLLFWQGDYVRAEQAAKQVAEQYGQTPSGIDAHRIAGDAAYWQGNFKDAVAAYRRYLDRNKTGVLADAVRRSYAYSLESDHRYAEAKPIYEQLVGVFDRESSAEFLLAAARCERLTNHRDEAVKLLQRVTSEYGETFYAQRARIELAELTAAR